MLDLRGTNCTNSPSSHAQLTHSTTCIRHTTLEPQSQSQTQIQPEAGTKKGRHLEDGLGLSCLCVCLSLSLTLTCPAWLYYSIRNLLLCFFSLFSIIILSLSIFSVLLLLRIISSQKTNPFALSLSPTR